MISRDVGQIKVVHGVDYDQYDASCGSLNGATSTADFAAGRIIDRMGLGANFNSALVHVSMYADIGTSTADAKAVKIGGWLYHSSTTCADDFDRYSTQNEKPLQALFLTGNTTSTLASGFMATSTSIGTYGTFSATATGAASGDYFAAYSLTGAGRYIRPYLIAQVFASSSGGSVGMGYANVVFGEPDEAPPTTTSTSPETITT